VQATTRRPLNAGCIPACQHLTALLVSPWLFCSSWPSSSTLDCLSCPRSSALKCSTWAALLPVDVALRSAATEDWQIDAKLTQLLGALRVRPSLRSGLDDSWCRLPTRGRRHAGWLLLCRLGRPACPAAVVPCCDPLSWQSRAVWSSVLVSYCQLPALVSSGSQLYGLRVLRLNKRSFSLARNGCVNQAQLKVLWVYALKNVLLIPLSASGQFIFRPLLLPP